MYRALVQKNDNFANEVHGHLGWKGQDFFPEQLDQRAVDGFINNFVLLFLVLGYKNMSLKHTFPKIVTTRSRVVKGRDALTWQP